MFVRSRIVAFAALTAVAVPVAATAQVGTFFVYPKLISRGTSTAPIAGKGTVTVKVFVHANGTIVPPTAVSKSTNPGDNAAALQIARTSKYKPATRDAKPVDAYYTFTLKFTGSAAVDITDPNQNADLKKIATMERAGNYAGAKSELRTYLQAKPDDEQANLLLAVAYAFTDDSVNAAKAFDKAGSVPPNDLALALTAYQNASSAAIKANDYTTAEALASKAIALRPTATGYDMRGTAEYDAKQYDAAIGDLEKARELANTQKSSSQNLAIIDTNLAASYFGAGQPEKGLAVAQEAQRADPSLTTIQGPIALYYDSKAHSDVADGKPADAIADYEAGAAAAPRFATQLYVKAANVYANDKPVDWKKVKAEADKALAVNPADVQANYVAGTALANDNDPKNALIYLNKAQASVTSSTDPALVVQITAAIKQLNPPK
jgi:tetratricopeptide (TPR) repeat protein